jgi:two-component system chemotaxis response regulator CheY
MRMSGKNILIVDDDASLRILLRKILETAGCEVEEAESVRIAIQKFAAKRPDLVVLDLSMPEHDGFVFLKYRAQNPSVKATPVLVLSSSSGVAIVERALALGANQYVVKPLRANLVIQKIRQLFYSQESFSFTFPDGKEPQVTAEIKGTIDAFSENQLKISSPVKFATTSPLKLKLADFLKAGGWELIARVDNRTAAFDEGLYAQHMTFMGMTDDERKKLQAWGRTL